MGKAKKKKKKRDLSVSVSTFMVFSFTNDKEVDNARGEVQRFMGFVVNDRNAVSVPITGPWHPSTEDEEWGTRERAQKTFQIIHYNYY